MNPTSYIGKNINIKIDRPLGSKHHQYGFVYESNYGYVPNTKSSDGEELDAYVLGINEPIYDFNGIVIALIHRTNDNDDKLILAPEGIEFSNKEIKKIINFQEKWFDSIIIRGDNNQFLNKLNNINLPIDDFSIFGSGPMAIRGLRKASDIDIIVNQDNFKALLNKGYSRDLNKGDIIINNEIEIWDFWGPGEWDISQLIKESDKLYGFNFVKLEEVFKWKKINNRKKDLRDINIIRKYKYFE